MHNEARDEIIEDPRPHLRWDSALAADALQYAQKLAQSNRMAHSSPKERIRNGQICGENIAWNAWGRFTLVDATRLWIQEKSKYRGQKIGSGGDSTWGHYTEIICPNVTRVGLGLTRTRSGETYVVARYNACQTHGSTPYDSRKGNIFKNRRWQPITGGRGHRSGSGAGRERRDLPQGGHQFEIMGLDDFFRDLKAFKDQLRR
ncbi:PR-1-like protein [Mollisia scopiformis]|uniref:PR-1-like protein n=1 Tax=Mollisia scopiformis TaxID=149040 RepID=A0A194XE90_MOLSC|nr:PR-1-like protein [Mollisia scopiformis]KUJ18493.1 PR-1-like protein [Mollisia scopiformis]